MAMMRTRGPRSKNIWDEDLSSKAQLEHQQRLLCLQNENEIVTQNAKRVENATNLSKTTLTLNDELRLQRLETEKDGALRDLLVVLAPSVQDLQRILMGMKD